MKRYFDISLFVMICLACSIDSGPVLAQPFGNINANLVKLQRSSLAWADFDNDGDLDLMLMGYSANAPHQPTRSFVYRNNGGTFVDIGAGLMGLQSGAVAWGDYDRDGDLDLAVSGQTDINAFARHTIIYRNDGGNFVNIAAGLPGVNNGSLAWGDFDNDGDLDLAVSGWTGTTRITRIYRNSGGSFTDADAGLTGVNYGQIAWADYDNDGDLDLAVMGWAGGSSTNVTNIYRNQGGVFTDIRAGLPGLTNGTLAWGDYDNDGDLDLMVAGNPKIPNGYAANNKPALISRVYANSNGTFVDAEVGLGQADSRGNMEYCSGAWGDYDNDGRPDLMIAGWTEAPLLNSVRICRVFHNNPGSGLFVNANSGLSGMQYCSVAWGDYDNDGSLDIANTGQVGGINLDSSTIYRNLGPVHNTAPTAPGNLTAAVSGPDVTFSWTAASDVETPSAGLTYNLRVGTSPGTDNLCSAMANLTTGFRRLPALGNAQKRLSWTLRGVSGQTLYWSVQAIDSAFAGGAWAPEAQVP